MITQIPEQEECSRSLTSSQEEPSLVPIHPHRFTSPRMKKLLASYKAPKHATVQVRKEPSLDKSIDDVTIFF